MRGLARQLIWLIRRDGFKTQAVDEGRPDVLIPEIGAAPVTFPGDLEATLTNIKTTLFVRREVRSPPDLKCANCGCNPSGSYYEEH